MAHAERARFPLPPTLQSRPRRPRHSARPVLRDAQLENIGHSVYCHLRWPQEQICRSANRIRTALSDR